MMGTHDSQQPLFYVGFDLDSRVRPDDPLRQVRDRIDFSFVRREVAGVYGRNGHVSIDPEVILKLLFLLFFDDVKSERELMRQLSYRLDYMWFLGFRLDDPTPNHSVLSKARRRWGPEVFERLFVHTVEQCVEAGLVNGSKLHMDATLVDADASKDSVKKGSPELIEALRRAYSGQESKLDDVSEADSASPDDDDEDDHDASTGASDDDDPSTTTRVNQTLLSTTDPDAAGLFAIYAQVYAVVGGTVAALIALNAGTLLPPADLRVRLWRRFVTHSLGIAYGNLGSRLVTYADVFVLSALINIAEVGEYRVAAQIAVGFMVVQHFLFLGLPWQLRRIGRSHLPGPGQVRVLSQQRLLLVLAGVAAVVLVGGAEPILALFGPRFTTMADALRLLIVVRLAALLWGPLHEVLVSAGRAIDDAHANLIGLAAWLAGFWAAETALAPIAAAIIANACAVAAGQGARHLRLRARGLSPTLGHPGGVGVPMGLCLASAVVTPLVL